MPHKLPTFVTENSTFRKISRKLDKVFFHKRQVSLYPILVNLFTNISKDDIFHNASSMAYSFTLAVFPAIIFLFSLIPYIPLPNINENIQELIGEMAMLKQVSKTITDVVSRPRGGLTSFSFLMSLFLSSNGMMQLSTTFNKIYKTVEKRGYFKTRFIATMLTVILAVVVFISISLLIIGEFVLDFLLKRGFIDDNIILYGIFLLRFFVVFVLFLIAISFIYYFAPALHNRWKFISIGSLIATLLTMLVSYIFSYYIGNFGTYNKLYGSIGAMIALMVWIYMVSVILVIGFEINVSIDQAIAERKEEMAKE